MIVLLSIEKKARVICKKNTNDDARYHFIDTKFCFKVCITCACYKTSISTLQAVQNFDNFMRTYRELRLKTTFFLSHTQREWTKLDWILKRVPRNHFSNIES